MFEIYQLMEILNRENMIKNEEKVAIENVNKKNKILINLIEEIDRLNIKIKEKEKEKKKDMSKIEI